MELSIKYLIMLSAHYEAGNGFEPLKLRFNDISLISEFKT